MSLRPHLHTPSSPHIHDTSSVPRLMMTVFVALTPAAIAHVWYFGWGLPIQTLTAIVFALGGEALVLKLRRRPVAPHLMDGSALVTATLLAFSLPPYAPWWIAALGALFAIVVVKQLYGGLGYNPFNPAMAAYVMLLVSFPLEMSTWAAPRVVGGTPLDPIQALSLIYFGIPPASGLDALSMATPLDLVKTQLTNDVTLTETFTEYAHLFGDFSGRGIEWIGNWILLGGLFLLYKRAIAWQIPLAMLGTLFVVALVFNLHDPDTYPSPLFHVFSGAALFGAFFIATDPVTAATTPKGRLIYGAGVGLLTYVIRTWGGYPDGVAFAVLLMNMAAPTIDYYTQPRVFGHAPKK